MRRSALSAICRLSRRRARFAANASMRGLFLLSSSILSSSSSAAAAAAAHFAAEGTWCCAIQGYATFHV
eukprot:CAMPEP_0175057226 /NCGR_PEP_ID=MMETSP0052_2-20121109/11139_1 /TAXON_ID=51329 ORGANISM="Polytomella parva, Strain SAG 63-3" /NCGR_SAMPLE_ID=MMETSP0052_2 /ASSEMBLY_ACC=CAM_ASM_000194 /LENGTH=68 /DNA_ID=CAMNT_0016322401 /DNA_START=305 /DNA_END=508 /DNA_ORIENTATION=+